MSAGAEQDKGGDLQPEGLFSRLPQGGERAFRRKYDLSVSSRMSRLREIAKILRRHKILSGDITPQQLRSVLEDLGPTFVKMGQILSMRSEILPQRFCDELALLRSDADPISFSQVQEVLAAELDRPLDQVFSSIDPKPLGSASLAQVHRATLLDGSDVAVKVQRPGVQETMALDIDILREVVTRLSRLMRGDAVIDFKQVVDELWTSFSEEVDFLAEARNLQEFRARNARCVFVDCPAPHMELCGEHVVVMDYIDGIGISEPKRLVAAGYDLGEIGVKLVDNYATQVLDAGFFHADPHPGNIIVSGGKIVYIDLGMTGRLSSYDRSCMSDIISAVGAGSSSKLKDALLRFAVSKDLSKIDHPQFLADLDLIVEEFGTVSLQELDLGALVFSLIGLARRNDVEMPPTITMMARGMVTLEGVLDLFLPDTNMLDIIRDHIRRSRSLDQVVADELKESAVQALHARRSVLSAAGDLGDLTHMLTRGQFKMNMEMLESRKLMDRVSAIVDRMTMGIIVAGLFIGSSVVYYSKIPPVIFGIPVLGFAGYVGAALLSVNVIVGIVRTNKPRK